MSERGISPQYYQGLNYNQMEDVASERKREWDGLVIKKLELKKPYNFKTYQDMIYTYDRRDGKTPYPNSRKETVIPVGSFQSQRASFDGLDPSPDATRTVACEAVLTPLVSGDDVSWDASVSSFWPPTSTGLVIGKYGTSGNRTYMRFSNFSASRVAIIDSAFLTVYGGHADSSTPVNVNIYGNAVANSIAPTSQPAAQALVLTGTSIAWDNIPAFTENAPVCFPDLKKIVKEIIAHPNWTSGNALGIVIHNNSSSGNRLCRSWDYGSKTMFPTLTIKYKDYLGS